MSVDTVSSLRMTRTIAASPQAVFDAWTQPEHMKKWACPAPGGVSAVEVDFRVGGAYKLTMNVDGQTHTAFGVYREIDPPNRVVYTWDWEEEANAMGETVVTVEFISEGEGTLVSLTHEGFPVAEAKAGHEEGWGACLAHFVAIFD